jgi:hypothetical protein
LATWLAGSVQSKFEPAKSSSISSVRTFARYFYNIIVTSGCTSARFVTSGRTPALYFFDIRFCYSTSHSNSIVIFPFVQAACSTSRRTTWRTASRPKITTKDLPLFVVIKENRLFNEFFLYVLEDLHTSQGLSALKFTSDDPSFVKETVERIYPLIPATPTAPQMLATRAFSRQLVAYIAAFLPTAPY